MLADLRPGEVRENYIIGARDAQVLDWQPEVTLEDGLHETAAYIRSAGAGSGVVAFIAP